MRGSSFPNRMIEHLFIGLLALIVVTWLFGQFGKPARPINPPSWRARRDQETHDTE